MVEVSMQRLPRGIWQLHAMSQCRPVDCCELTRSACARAEHVSGHIFTHEEKVTFRYHTGSDSVQEKNNCATCSSRGCEYTGHSCLSGFPLQEVLSTYLMAGEPSVDETSAPSHRPTGPRSCFVEVGGMSWSIFPCFSFSARGPWAAIVLEHEVTVIDSSSWTK